jgi:benzoyl-CoA reductase/2-hydroxyglutaryl-CoA dehydratase subunit BcrC/BadD/HgdB
MDTFNMKQWLQENKIGVYTKARLTENIADEAAEMLMRDIEDSEDMTYTKSQLERVFDTIEDSYGKRFDDDTFQDAISKLKAKGIVMTFKEDAGFAAKVRPSDPQSGRF